MVLPSVRTTKITIINKKRILYADSKFSWADFPCITNAVKRHFTRKDINMAEKNMPVKTLAYN